VMVFFVVGAAVLAFVDVKEGRTATAEAAAPAATTDPAPER
jgi:hypothetical protein